MKSEEVTLIKSVLDEIHSNSKISKDLKSRIHQAITAFDPVYEREQREQIKRKYEKLNFNYKDYSPQKEISKVINAAFQSISLLEEAKEDLMTYDKATQDILHALELADLTEEEEIRLTRELKEIRTHRRLCKNFIELVTPLSSFSQKNKSFFDSFRKLASETQKIKGNLEKRRYTPRVKHELAVYFSKPEEETILEIAQ